MYVEIIKISTCKNLSLREQHPILEQAQSIYLTQYERPSFTYHKTKGKFVILYSNLCIFVQQAGKQRILHQIIASITWVQYALISSGMEFWFTTVFSHYLKRSTLSNDLFFTFLWFYPAFC
jgi:hypothetical protein